MASIKLVNSLTEEQVEFMTKILGEIGASLEASGLSFKIFSGTPQWTLRTTTFWMPMPSRQYSKSMKCHGPPSTDEQTC